MTEIAEPQNTLIASDFNTLGLSDTILSVLAKLGYKKPSPIQEQAIPAILEGRDVVGSAQTGTGKTAAFVLPMLQKLSAVHYTSNKPIRALILTPTRELASQVYESIVKYSAEMHPKIQAAVVFGGVKIDPQVHKIKRGLDILVATPGRLMDLENQGHIKLNKIDFFVLDEADRMLDMGFIGDIRKIQAKLPSKRQTLFFSATFSKEIQQLIQAMLSNPVEIKVSVQNTAAVTIQQVAHPIFEGEKMAALKAMILSEEWEQILVFVNTKRHADRITKELKANHIAAAVIHGDRSQKERTNALNGLKNGSLKVLVATDVAARGIDIPQLPCVINYDLPKSNEDYVHRIGRTGRAGKTGVALSIINGYGFGKIAAIEKLMGKKIKIEGYGAFKMATAADGPQEEPKPGQRKANTGAPKRIAQKNTSSEQAPKQAKSRGRRPSMAKENNEQSSPNQSPRRSKNTASSKNQRFKNR